MRNGPPYRGTSLTRNTPSVGPYSSICLWPYGGPRGGAVSYGRGTPVASKWEPMVSTRVSATPSARTMTVAISCCKNIKSSVDLVIPDSSHKPATFRSIPGGGQPLLRERCPISYQPRPSRSSRPLPGCYVTKFAPQKALNLIVRCKLAFDETLGSGLGAALHLAGETCVSFIIPPRPPYGSIILSGSTSQVDFDLPFL